MNVFHDRPILITGAAGFIGYHLSKALVSNGFNVVGLDNFNAYYDPALKRARVSHLQAEPKFTLHQGDICDADDLAALFRANEFQIVINLAAQAGVRHSIKEPHSYVTNNVSGFLNILECCVQHKIEHLIYASSSSVYGANTDYPFATTQTVAKPKNIYAATKRMNELMAYNYASLYGLPSTGLRFFTVYGSWYRPDMALYLFMDAMTNGQAIKVFNNGNMRRDFTHISDVVEGIKRVLPLAPQTDDEILGIGDGGEAPTRLLNIGNATPQPLMKVISLLEEYAGLEATKNFLPMQPGDLEETAADCTPLQQLTDFAPSITLEEGLQDFVSWYLDYHAVPTK